jgi:hypothetical protein
VFWPRFKPGAFEIQLTSITADANLLYRKTKWKGNLEKTSSSAALVKMRTEKLVSQLVLRQNLVLLHQNVDEKDEGLPLQGGAFL